MGRGFAAGIGALAALASGAVLGVARGGGDDDLPPPPKPDLLFYVRHVAPFLDAKCAPCHRSGAGGFTLSAAVPGVPEERRRREEFREVVRFTDALAPWRSRLIVKALPEAEGGVAHAGGSFLTADAEEYDTLLDFASGATLSNLPPEPEPGKDRRAKPGEEVVLDGSLSYDRDEDRLQYRWDLAARPAGSNATLVGEREPYAKLTVDAPGTYVARLRVFDGKVWSAPKPVAIEALDRVEPATPDPVLDSGLSAVDPAALRLARALYGDLLGRPPTPPEAVAAAGKPAREVAATLLATLEAGRAWVEDASGRLGLVGAFAPSSEAVAALPMRIAAGSASPADAEATLVRDPAFLRAHPPGPALADAILPLVYASGDPASERQAVLAACAGTAQRVFEKDGVASAAGVLDAALAADTFRSSAMERHLARLLASSQRSSFPEIGRPGDSIAALSLACVTSPRYEGGKSGVRWASDPAFVRAVFADLLGRRPTAAEAAAMARALAVIPANTAARAAVVDVLLDSGEVPLPLLVDVRDPDAWLFDRFLRYLGRAPGVEEAKAYRAALVDPDGGPHVVIRALLSTPEYASR